MTAGATMPFYAFSCSECNHVADRRLSVEDRNLTGPCVDCGGLDTMRRMYQAPYMAAIGGIPNRINKDWNEGTGDTKIIPMDGRRELRREWVRARSKKKD